MGTSVEGGDLTPGEEGGDAGGMPGSQSRTPPSKTCMAACWAHHQRPSVGTGSPGRTALPSIRAWDRGYDWPGNRPAQGGRQVPHRVLHEELFGDRSDPRCVLCNLGQQSKGLWARATIRLVTQRYSMCRTNGTLTKGPLGWQTLRMHMQQLPECLPHCWHCCITLHW